MTHPAPGRTVRRLPTWFAEFIARPRVSRIALTLATFVDRPLMRASGGRLRLSFVIPVLLLRCRGARSGALREVPLLYVPHGDQVLLVASNGGQQREPAWAHNLRAHPDVECLLCAERRPFSATELAGPERDRAWRLALEIYPGYARYAERIERRIAVFRLTPAIDQPARVPLGTGRSGSARQGVTPSA